MFFENYNLIFTIKIFTLVQVSLTYENGDLVNAKDIGRKVMDKALETHRTKLEGVHLAYDGDKSLFTSKSFPEPKFELKVGLEDASSNRYQSTVLFEICSATFNS